MKTWLPLIIASTLAVLVNAYPAFMAFVVGSEEWVTAGWALYFITIPAGAAIVAVGLAMSLVMLFLRRSK